MSAVAESQSLGVDRDIPSWMIFLFKRFAGEISTKQSARPSGVFQCACLFVKHICAHVFKHVQADWHLLQTPEGSDLPPS